MYGKAAPSILTSRESESWATSIRVSKQFFTRIFTSKWVRHGGRAPDAAPWGRIIFVLCWICLLVAYYSKKKVGKFEWNVAEVRLRQRQTLQWPNSVNAAYLLISITLTAGILHTYN